MAQKTKNSIFFSTSAVFIILLSVFLINYPPQQVGAADDVVSCNSTTLDQAALDNYVGDNVTFTDGGDGICILTGTLSANSVTVNADVTLTHNAEGFDKGGGVYTGVEISTDDYFTIASGGSIDVDEKGCVQTVASGDGRGPDSNNLCTNATAGYGDGTGSNSGAHGAGYGGLGGDGSTQTVGGATYGDADAPILFGSSGGAGYQGYGGYGGGVIKLTIGGDLSMDGTLTADAGDGQFCPTVHNCAGGGGAGGSIYVNTAGTLTGSGSFSATGGDGNTEDIYDGGGGGGGRISLITGTNSFTDMDSTTFDVSKGSAGGDTAVDGDNGTVFVQDTGDSIDIYHGFTFDDTDYSITDFTVDSSANNMYCDSAADSPSITATNLNLDGTLDCALSNTTSSFNFSASTDFSVATGTSMTISGQGADVDFNIPAGNNQIWTDFIFTGPDEGDFTINDVISVTLAGTTTLSTNPQWTNLTSLNIGSSSTVSANAKGCKYHTTTSQHGRAPDGSNVCSTTNAGGGHGDTAGDGASGAGHGGEGGDGSTITGGSETYGDGDAPILFGASGGNIYNGWGGSGGGLIKFDVNGNVVIDGALSANGGDGQASATHDGAGGGGSGGSIYINSTGTLTGSGSFAAAGGDGAADTSTYGGGGGGGKIGLIVNTNSFTNMDSADFDVAKGVKGGGAALDGEQGTVFVKNTTGNTIDIYHGFNFDDTDFSIGTWTCDSSAANMYCDSTATTPSISATDITLSGGLDCAGASLTSFDLAASNSLGMSNLAFDLPAEMELTFDDASSVSLTNTTIQGNVNWQNLTSLSLDSSSSIIADGKGCQGVNTVNSHGYGPDGSNVCTVSTTGYSTGNSSGQGVGGASHGGLGGAGSTMAIGGTTYGDSGVPVFYGSSSGNSYNAIGGDGGGIIRLDVDGTFTHNGALSVNGTDGTYSTTHDSAAGGGSGGSIYITTSEISNGSGSDGIFSADGGAGGTDTGQYGGGAGGGRISISGVNSFDSLDTLTAAGVATGGASGGGSALAGSNGSLSTTFYTAPSQPTITAGDSSRNMALNSSVYSSNGASHTSSSWRVCSNSPCEGVNVVWEATADTSNLESTTANTTNGTFKNALSGKTKLAPGSSYQIAVLHTNAAGDSAWSNTTGQSTVANNVPNTPTNTLPTNGATDQSKNITLIGSDYNDGDQDDHNDSSWSVYESSDCTGSAKWSSLNDSSNLEIIAISSGTLADDHAGKSELKGHTEYSWQVRYDDEYDGESNDSTCTTFTTLNTTPTANAGDDKTATEEDELTLVGSSSDDDWNDTVTETWTEILDASSACTLDGTTVTTSNQEESYTCQFQVEADDGQGTTSTDTMTVSVTASNDAPTMDTISAQEVDEEEVLTINVSASDADSSSLTLSASSLPTGATFTDNEDGTGTLSWTPTSSQSGEYTVTFSASDGTTTTTQDVTITVNDTVADEEPVNTIEDIGLISGTDKGAAVITLYDNDNNELCSVRAWREGGVQPYTIRLNNNYYIAAIKNKVGSTIHIYDLNCNIIEKKRLSPKLHPREMVIRNFMGQNKYQEIAVTSRRGTTAYGKVFRYNVVKDKWYLLKQKTFKPVPTGYNLKKTKKGNVLIQKNNKTLHKWSI